jgi:hypothetical protein
MVCRGGGVAGRRQPLLRQRLSVGRPHAVEKRMMWWWCNWQQPRASSRGKDQSGRTTIGGCRRRRKINGRVRGGVPVPHLHVKEAAGDGARAGVWCARAERGLAGRCVAALAPGTWRTRGGGRMALRRARFRWPGRVVRVNVWAWGCWIRHPGGWLAAPGPVG